MKPWHLHRSFYQLNLPFKPLADATETPNMPSAGRVRSTLHSSFSSDLQRLDRSPTQHRGSRSVVQDRKPSPDCDNRLVIEAALARNSCFGTGCAVGRGADFLCDIECGEADTAAGIVNQNRFIRLQGNPSRKAVHKQLGS